MKTKKLFLLLSLLFSALAVTSSARAGVLGNALSFNGVNQYVSVPNFGNISPTNEVTVEFWANAGAPAQQSAFMLNPDATTDRFNAHISYFNGNTYWDCGNINTTGRVSAVGPPNTISNWVHYALVASQSGNFMQIYTNGNLFVSQTGMTPFVRGSYELRIGGNTSYFFNGQLDDFRVWNIARTQVQIQSDLGTPLTGSETNLVLYYKFDSSSGTVATNAATTTGATYNGILVNSPAWVASSAADTLVTNNLDSGVGSLRWAVSNAIAGTTINFATNLSGATITLTSGMVAVNQSLVIDGSALTQSVTISGNNASGIFNVGSGATVSLTGLTLVNGNEYDGGAVYGASGSTLNIARCTFTGNSALEGGAILNDGVLQVQNSTFSGNYGAYGGALQCRSLATLTNCTISANNGQNCGGIYNKNTTLTINNCIIGANTASVSPADLFSENAALVMVNTNLIQSFGSTVPTNISGPAQITSAPMLSPLGNYGGPLQTMLPLPGSPVIDAAVTNSLTVDQRGWPRVIGPAPDLGAVEFQDASPLVTTLADSGVGTLRYAVTYTTNGQVVTFGNPLSGGNILLTSGEIVLNTSVTIDASALPAAVGIDGNQNSRIFRVGSGKTVVLNSLIITNGNGTGSTPAFVNYGGGVLETGISNSLTLNNCVLVGNYATNFGGGVYSSLGTLTMNRTTISNNYSVIGAGVCLESVAGTFNSCTFAGNRGTALQCLSDNHNTTVSLINSTFNGNVATNIYGSAIDLHTFSAFIYTNIVGLTNCTITGNSTIPPGKSGAVQLQGTTTNFIYLYNTIVSGNTSNGLPQDITGFVSSFDIVAGAHNIVGQILPGTSLVNGVNGNQVGVNNSQLAPLGYYGGNTPTMPPLLGSPAVDTGGATTLTTDQRGFPRPVGQAADIGAVEGVYVANYTGPGTLKNPVKLGNGSFQFNFTNYSDMSLTVWTSTNLALPSGLWSKLGAPVEAPAGTFTFSDPQAATTPRRFYRVSNP